MGDERLDKLDLTMKKYPKKSLAETYEAAKRASRRVPELEAILATDPYHAVLYAKNVLGGRFEEAEDTIARDSSWALCYAVGVIRGRWPRVEPMLARCPTQVDFYATNVIRGRFIEGERTLVGLPYYAVGYAINLMKSRWPEAEQHISRIGRRGCYLDYVKAFPEAEAEWLAKGCITA